jgi:hypothetical protein
MSAWRGREQHILFVTSGGIQAELTILAYLKEDAANGPAVRDPVSYVFAELLLPQLLLLLLLLLL